MSEMKGTCSGWIPHVHVDCADWVFLPRSRSRIRAFLKAGGNPEHIIIEHYVHDAGGLDPLWNSTAFLKWTQDLKDFGVRYIVAPNFSMWADAPVVLQLHSIYKTAVTTRDYADSGFKVIPDLQVESPTTGHIAIQLWPRDLPVYMLGLVAGDKTVPYTQRLLQESFKRIRNYTISCKRMLLWASQRRWADDWNRECSIPADWVRSEMHLRRTLLEFLKKNKKPSQKSEVPV